MKLTTPAPYVVENPHTITDPRLLNDWIEQLPVADPVAAADTLLDGLKLLNRHPRTLPQGQELMLIYLPPFMELLTRIRHLGECRGHADRHRNDALFSQVMESLSHEMGYGFKRALMEALRPGWGAREDPGITAMIYWATQCLTYDLMFAFADYRPEPRSTWPEFIKLYLLAKRQKVSGTPVRDPYALPTTTPSVGLAFRRALLITILDPYKLRRGDVWHAYDYLSHFGKSALITTFKVPEPMEGNFLVDLKGNEKPLAFRLDKIPPRPREYLLFNANPLNAVVHRHYKMLEINPDVEIEGLYNLEGPHAMHLFRTMLVSWHISPSRRHERVEEYDWLMAICGISEICRFLETQQTLLDAQDGPSDPAADAMDAMDAMEELEIHHPLNAPREPQRSTYRWRQTNFSASGAGVVLPVSEAQALQVGQLVLTESERVRGVTRQRIGVVRRLVRRDSNNMEAGIQYIGGKIIATRIHHRDKPIAVLVADRGEGYNRVLIAPRSVHRTGRIIEIKTGDKTAITVKAGKLLETTCCIDRFEVERR